MRFRLNIYLSSLVFSIAILYSDQSSAFEHELYDYLRLSYSPVSKGMGGCEINLIDEYSSINNPGTLGILHLDKRIAFYIPGRLNWGDTTGEGIELKSTSMSIGYPLRIYKNKRLGFGLAYSSLNYDVRRWDFLYMKMFSYREKARYFTISTAYSAEFRVGIGFAVKRIESSFTSPPVLVNNNEDTEGTGYDFGAYFDYSLRNLENLADFFLKIDGDDIKHDIIPSFAYVRSNMSDDYRRQYPIFGRTPFPEISKYGISLLFISKYRNAEVFSFKIAHESANAIEEDDVDFGKAGLEVGAWGTLYMRAGFWSASTIDQKIWTYGFGLNIGGLANILYATGKIRTINPIARYILKNISISADYAMERSDDESVYEDSDYFKICFSL